LALSSIHPERLHSEGQPDEMLLDMDTIPTGEIEMCDKNYCGYRLEDKVSKWITAALKRKSFVLRAQNERLTKLDPTRQIYLREKDRKRTFTTDAALHMINLQSVDELR
jgi:hypothetical protein